MARPRIHDDQLRDRLLLAAGRQVAEHGSDTLTLRGLAAAVGTSTTAIYSLFGGRSELFSALFIAAFEGFGAGQRAVGTSDDPLNDVLELGYAYRRWGIGHPHLYAVMFGGAVPQTAVSALDWERCASTMDPLQHAVDRTLTAGVLTGGPAEVIAHALWATVHGLVSLELTAMAAAPEPGRAALFEATVRAMVRGWTGEPAQPALDKLRNN